MRRDYNRLNSSILFFTIALLSVSLPVFGATISTPHGTLQRYIGAGSWGFDTGEKCISLGITVCARAQLGIGGDLLTVTESGQGNLDLGTSQLYFSGSSNGGSASMNFGVETGVSVTICFLGACYDIPVPFVGYRDFLLSDVTTWTPYFPGQQIRISDTFEREALICAGVDIGLASGYICLEGSATVQQILTPASLATSKGTFTYNNQRKSVNITCPSSTVSSIRKNWNWNGSISTSLYVTGIVSVLGFSYDIPLPIITNYQLPIDEWVASSFPTTPYRTVEFSPIPDIGIPVISGLASTVCGGQQDCFSASASGNVISWSWSSSCGGNFSSSTSSSTCWTPPTGYTGQCQITVTAEGVCGPKSRTKTVTVNQLPSTPGTPSASPNPACVNTEYCLSWSTVSGATSYEISQNNGAWVDIGNTTSKCYTKSSSGSYSYRIRAKNSCGTSSASGSRTVTVNAAPDTPSYTSPLDGATNLSQPVSLDWSDVSGADSNQVQVDDNSDFSSPEKDVKLLSSIYNVSDLANGTRYYWRVRANNSCGWGNWSSGTQDFTTDNPNSVEEINSSNLPEKFVLSQNHPNPFNPATRIEFAIPHGSFVKIDIYDHTGRHIRNLTNQWLSAGYKGVVWDGCYDNGRTLPSGIYISRLVTPEYSKSIKMVLLK